MADHGESAGEAHREGAARFRVVRSLGQGGMGAVELVWDEQRGEQVARKRALLANARTRVRFKREFRAVELLRHPALVRLLELGEDHAGLYFTMEAVLGVDLAAFCRRELSRAPTLASDVRALAERTRAGSCSGLRSRSFADTEVAVSPLHASGPAPADTPREVQPVDTELDLSQLAIALPWVLEGLSFLHANGLVHRDLKPSNVVVSLDGHARLLDFGILAEARRPSADGIVGTPAYLAPEQIRQAPARHETDLYALGVVLFELATGRTPFAMTTVPAMLVAHLMQPPPRVEELVRGVPRELGDAIHALLAKEPEQRPSLARLAETLLPAIGARAPVLTAESRGARLLGRDVILGHLTDALDDEPLVVLSAPTGVGKTALLERLLAHAEAKDWVVLRSRGRPSERLPFTGVDEAIDALALVLEPATRHAQDDVQIEQARARAAHAFPALGTPDTRVITRVEAFEGVTSLLRALAERHGRVVIGIDDFQWLDRDALALLRHLMLSDSPGVHVVASLRDDVDSAAREWLTALSRGHVVPIPPVDEDASLQIVLRFAGEGRERSPDELRALARACEGRPLLAELVGRGLAQGDATRDDPSAWLDGALGELDEAHQRLLALVVAAGEWTDLAGLAEALQLPRGFVDDALASMASSGLVRRAAALGGEGQVDVYHASVRRAAERALDPHVLRGAHGALAERYTRAEGAALRVFHHLRRAGRHDDARRVGEQAAEEAAARYAHDLAAEVYGTLLDEARGDRAARYCRGRASALAAAGRYEEAALAFAELARLDPEQAADATMHEAHAWLAAHRVELGTERLAHALALAGERTPLRAPVRDLWAAVAFSLGPVAASRPTHRSGDASVGSGALVLAGSSANSAALRAAGARDVRVAQIYSYFEPLTGIRLLRRARRRFVLASASHEAAWCDLLFAYLAHMASPDHAPVRLAERYLARAHALLPSPPPEHVEIQALLGSVAGLDHLRMARWDPARAAFEGAAQRCAALGAGDAYVHGMVLAHVVATDLYSERVERLDDSLPSLRRALDISPDVATRAQIDFARVAYETLRGDLAETRALLPEAERRASVAPDVFRPIAAASAAFANTYLDVDPRVTRKTLADKLARTPRLALVSMFVGFVASQVALTEARALRVGDPDASAARVRRWARRAASAPPFSTTAALRALAYAEDARGRPERAIAWLERAVELAARHDQPLSHAIGLHQLGVRLGGSEGAERQAQARSSLVRSGAEERVLFEDPLLR